jgi:ABC-type bacteriocin/lantibiotic exporter with double-glycine peptidase domain
VLVGLGGLLLAFVYAPALGAFTVVVLLAVAALTWLVARTVVGYEVRVRGSLREVNSRAFQLIGHVDKLRVAAAEEEGFAHWAGPFRASRVGSFASRVAQNRLSGMLGGLTLIAYALAFYLVGDVLSVSTSTFLGFNVAFAQVVAAAIVAANAAVALAQLLPRWKSLQGLLDREVEDTVDRPDPGALTGAVETSQVSFRYGEDGPLILDDVSLRAAPGEFVGVVGTSGSGKSTLLRLLLGFERPNAGAVLYDEQDLADIDVGAVRRQCGVVLQDDRLMVGDLRTNIVGAGLYSDAQAWEAARMVGLDRDIEGMPMGMETFIGEGGAGLSGGQRQRVILARAMVTRPRILYLDEATSALDNRTQETVMESMRRLTATRIVIAHRLNTIRDADQILVMDAGRVVERGTYDELMAQDGLFRALATRQMT